MAKRKAAYILLLIIALPSLALPVTAAANPVATFINDLEILIPAVLFILSLIALRSGDYEYSFMLLLAATIVTIALASVTGGNLGTNGVSLTLVQLQVTVNGPTSAYTGNTETYTVSWSPSMSGTVIWTVLYNGSIVYNATGGTSFTYTFKYPGKYIVAATVINQQNFAGGSGAVLVTVTNPPSPLGWIEGAITGAVSGLINSVANAFTGFLTTLLQIFGAPLEWMTYSPTPYASTSTPNASPIVPTIYNQMKDFSVGLAMLFIAFSIAYNAIRGEYADLVDLAGDVMYKLSVWGLFFAGGLTIYTYAANFINSIIYSVAGPYLGIATLEYTGGATLFTALFALMNGIPFGFGDALSMFLSLVMFLLAITLAIATIKYAVMLAIVDTIPLWATLWIFEWTRKIAMVVIDLLIGLMVVGLIAAVTFAILATLPLGALMFAIDPIAMDGEFLFSLAFFVFGLRPGEHMMGAFRKKNEGGSGNTVVVVENNSGGSTSSEPPAGRYM
ncbi:Ig-like domain repeat protein [Saccharolobus solfataricus]|uniref:Ig-like domain repeat protein n=2 Tax=Saccharolobus solfataricus TaxID=2287 RepID=A0A0E3MC37_SACSO|nr:Ig-like domain repeat protein [Saccharolobus solfataricus]AKA73828.1 Ig-like domain repeat protein [Saccharolobus solfataricus]AKA76525.1 Ig-like domain repeat protein [Saccharolobus solfataricus]AKA79218.1 Ig-like domain repeat protein [Saccharolobus solfataricus]AZF68308.1 Ig-like domain repeat protein [Saccharolobus solfataricus]AZF70928.1 Ig-like domain repeat protein [Saccharolobus solfataricus]